MAPFIDGAKERTKEFVSDVRHVFLDIDADGPQILERINSDVAAGVIPEPWFIVETSPGKFQIGWGVEGFSVVEQESLNRTLQQRYGTDPAATDTARVLRIPGFVNHKYAGKPVARLLDSGNLFGSSYSLADFKIELTRTPTKTTPVRNEIGKIPQGFLYHALISEAGALRQRGYSVEAIESALVDWAGENCEGPIDYEKVRQYARATEKWEQGNPAESIVLVGGKSPSELVAANAIENWRNYFRSIGQLEQGEIVMLIKNFMPEGVTFFGGLPGEGKTLLGLSVSKALTSGRSFLNRSDFAVPTRNAGSVFSSPRAATEHFANAARSSICPMTQKLFLCRTISEGTMLLSDPMLIEAVRQMKPLVILDTMFRIQ